MFLTGQTATRRSRIEASDDFTPAHIIVTNALPDSHCRTDARTRRP